MNTELTISKKSILFAIGALLGTVLSLYVIYRMIPVLVILLISTIIVISMEHLVKFLMRQKVMNKPLARSTAVLISYFIVIIAVVTSLTIVFPPVLTQAQKLVSNLNTTYKDVLQGYDKESIKTLIPNASDISTKVFNTTYSLLVNLAGIFSVLIVSIYMSIDWENIKRRIYSLFVNETKVKVQETIEEIEVSIGHWVKGQLTLMVIVGLMSFSGLVILKIEYPLALGLISGLLEVVPMLGPLVAVLIAGVVGFSESVTKGLLAIALFTIIQQIENNFLVPKVMHRVSGFSPLVILISLLAGNTLFGVIGAIVAVPAMMTAVIITKRFIRDKE